MIMGLLHIDAGDMCQLCRRVQVGSDGPLLRGFALRKGP